MIPRYISVIWLMTFLGECFPEKVQKWLYKYVLEVEKEPGASITDPGFERQLAAMFFTCEDSLTGQVVKYMDEEGSKEEMAYNVFVFEKRNIVYGVTIRCMLEDFPNIIMQLCIIMYSHSLVSCKKDLDNYYL